MFRVVRKSFSPLLGIPVILTVAIYALHAPNSFFGLDIHAYERVLHPNAFCDTALQLLLDIKGKVVPGYYAPLSSLSLLADSLLGESGVADVRITIVIQVILHCLNGILAFGLFRLLQAKPLTALIASSIFLLHPLQVTVVMWFAERKTLLATFFFLITYMSFIQYRKTGARSYYGISLLCFLLGLLSKPVLVMFPLLAFVGDMLDVHSESLLTKRSMDSVYLERDSRYSFLVRRAKQISPALVPFVLEAFGFGILTISSESADGVSLPLLHRPLIAVSALWFYVEKVLAPTGLMYIYPRWIIDFSVLWCWIPVVLTALAVLSLVRYRERIGSLAWWALACFVAMPLPGLGIIKFGLLQYTFVANHLCYLPLLGGALLIALAAESLLVSSKPALRAVVAALLVCYGLVLLERANEQAKIWSSPVKLWTHNLEKCPTCWVPNQELGTTLLQAGQPAKAAELFRRAIEIKPDAHLSYNHLGEAMLRTGHLSEAEKYFEHSIQLCRNDPAPYNNMGNLMRVTGKTGRAIEFYRQALALSPHNAIVHSNLGTMMLQTGNVTEAIQAFQRAIALKPRFAKAHANLGFALLQANRVEDAEAHLITATDIDRNLAAAQSTLGRILIARGEFARAITHLSIALEMQPDLADAKINLDLALQHHKSSSDHEERK